MLDDVNQMKFDKMDLVHHLLSGCKAKFSEDACDGIDKCRRSTGGAGFLSNAGFTDIYQTVSANPTFEGENTVMLLQSVKYVFKLYKNFKKDGKPLPELFSYISNIDKLLQIKGRGSKIEELLDLNFLKEAMAVRAGSLLKEVYELIANSKESQLAKENEIYA